ncbi:putative homeobox domain protein [Trichinella nativa]|uniref:Putative homeobox domain protein n=1 Tax=Trichinella nativa TaxID=6335 RepID=A0A1Y3EX42_9BILA|nr:putative homeobox domain protein [Trichinella nativa]
MPFTMKNLLSFDSNGSRQKSSAFHSYALSHSCSGSAFTHVHKLESAQSTEISKNAACTSEHINIGHSAYASSTLSALPLNSYTNAMAFLPSHLITVQAVSPCLQCNSLWSQTQLCDQTYEMPKNEKKPRRKKYLIIFRLNATFIIKKFRTVFTEHQTKALEKIFKVSQYPDTQTRIKLGLDIHLPEDRIQGNVSTVKYLFVRNTVLLQESIDVCSVMIRNKFDALF